MRDLLEFYVVDNVRVRVGCSTDVYPLPQHTHSPPPLPTPTTHTHNLKPTPDQVIFDSGCRLKFDDPPPDDCSWPKTHVDWLHAHAHNEKCRLLNSAMYHEGMGRTHGSLTENLWVRSNRHLEGAPFLHHPCPSSLRRLLR